MTNVLLTIIAVLLFARIVLQVRQGKRAVEKGYAAPSEAEHEAKDTIANYMQPFSEVIRRFMPYNNTREEFLNILREMGDTETKIEDLISLEENE